jgi:hypothetical protein
VAQLPKVWQAPGLASIDHGYPNAGTFAFAPVHDLYGVPASDKVDDKSDPYYGIGTFKRSFNKHVTDYVGTYDMVVKKSTYNRWRRFGERLTLGLHWRLRHENWY